MSDEHTLTLRDITADRDCRFQQYGKHYRQVAHWLRGVAAKCGLPDPQPYQRAIALAPNEPRLRAALKELPKALLSAEWHRMVFGVFLPAWWYQETIKRLAADEIKLVRSAKRDPRKIEQCLPDFWQLPEHDVHRQILEREEEDWQYAIISPGAPVIDYWIEPQTAGLVLQRPWCPLSRCLSYVATISGKPEGAWLEVRNAISDGQLRARGTCCGIDHQPLRPEWMRIAMWGDAKDDTIFFREEKGRDLVPPLRVPGHITNIEIYTADIERCWGPNAKSPDDMESVGAPGGKSAPSSIDKTLQGTRGPKRGTVDRYGESDRELFPVITGMMRAEKISASDAASRLAEGGKVAGTGAPKSRAKRLAASYLEYERKKLAETR